MIQFPAKSAEAVVLEKQHFSLKDLNNAIKEAVKRKEQHNVEPGEHRALMCPSLVRHTHTSTGVDP